MTSIDDALKEVAASIEREARVNIFDTKGQVIEYRVANFKRYQVAYVSTMKIKHGHDKYYEPLELYKSLKQELILAKGLKGDKFSDTEGPNKTGTDKTGKNELAELNDEENKSSL